MNDKSNPDSPRLRDLLGRDPDGRKIVHWSGVDRQRDINNLIDAVTAAGELFIDHGGRIVRPIEGDLAPVNLAALHTFIGKHVCGVRLVNPGPGYEREYFSYQFPQRSRLPQPTQENPNPSLGPEREPDFSVLDEIYRQLLAPRLPRVE